ncbi:uncharacterized protein PpBr36_11195 [Pyricularia pennisetigena]|nr:uncharacterized protein PpBr36_11195 [Pyricularia pennisetigena]TLS20405.1 hypothetical protein PpBr36_11195 [Pyricularia pennisetigena]
MFELRDSPGKGKGLFVLATGIQKGDRVITEAPILTADLVWMTPTTTTSRGISGGRNSAKSHSKMLSRPRAPGDELTVAYDSGCTVQNMAKMKSAMGFRCACPRCSLPPDKVAESDKRRHELNVTLTNVDLAYRAADPRDKCRKEGEGEEYGREQSNEHMQRSPLSFAPASIIPLCRRIVALQYLEFGIAPITY